MDEAKMVSAEEAQALLDGVRGGLWTAVALDGDRYEIVGDDDAHIASVEDDEGDDEFLASDNADLIAAAPALARTVVALDAAERERNRLRADMREVLGAAEALADIGAARAAMDLATVEGHRDDLREALTAVTAERDDARAEAGLLREIIEGRTTPPTDAEIEAHAAAGCGWWLIVTEHSFDYDMPDAVARDEWVQAGAVRWCPCADDGRPCAWPTVTP